MTSKKLSRPVYKIRYTDCLALHITEHQSVLEEPIKPIVLEFRAGVLILPGSRPELHRDLGLASFFLRRMLNNDFIPQPFLSSK